MNPEIEMKPHWLQGLWLGTLDQGHFFNQLFPDDPVPNKHGVYDDELGEVVIDFQTKDFALEIRVLKIRQGWISSCDMKLNGTGVGCHGSSHGLSPSFGVFDSRVLAVLNRLDRMIRKEKERVGEGSSNTEQKRSRFIKRMDLERQGFLDRQKNGGESWHS